jgi:hypothetical protein
MFPNNIVNATLYFLSDQNFMSPILYQLLYFGLIGDKICESDKEQPITETYHRWC